MPVRMIRLVSSLLPVLAGASLLAAQQQAPADSQDAGSYVLRENVRRVILDVVVTDSQGRPVRDLTRKDFAILEDGADQPIRSFEQHDPATEGKFDPPKLPPLPPNTYFNLPKTEESGPLYVIVYDGVNMEPQDQPQARKQLMDFLANKPAGSRFALFFWGHQFSLIQGFTADPNELLQSFDIHRKNGAHIPYEFLMGDNAYNGDCNAPFAVLTAMAHYLEGYPGRKNVIWMTTGLPSPIGSLISSMLGAQNAADAVANAAANPGSTIGSGSNPGTGSAAPAVTPADSATILRTEGEGGNCRVPTGGHEMIDTLATAQVAIYPLMVHGADMRGPGFDDVAQVIAKATGGHAFFNSNDIKAAIDQATADGSNYYEVSYAPANTALNGKKRSISIKLSQKGYHLSYRRFYFADDPESFLSEKDKIAKSASPDSGSQNEKLLAYLRHGGPLAYEIVFKAHFGANGPAAMATPAQMAAFNAARPSKSTKPIPVQTYVIDLAILGAQFQARAKAHPDVQQSLSIATAAYDEDANLVNSVVQSAIISSPAAAPNAKPYFRVQQSIDVPKDAKWLRIAVRDPVSNHIGAMEVELPLQPEDSSQAAQVAKP